MKSGKKKKQREFSDVASVRSRKSDVSAGSKRSKQSRAPPSDRSRGSQAPSKRGGHASGGASAAAEMQLNLAVEARRTQVLQQESEAVLRELTRVSEEYELKRNAHTDVVSSFESRLKAARLQHTLEREAITTLEERLTDLQSMLEDLTQAVDVKRVELAKHFIPRATGYRAAAASKAADAIPWEIFPPSVVKLVNPAAGKQAAEEYEQDAGDGADMPPEDVGGDADSNSDLSNPLADTQYEQELARNAKFLYTHDDLPFMDVRVPGLASLKDEKWLAALAYTKDYRRGETIIYRGRRTHEMFRVQRGQVNVISSGTVVATHAAGHYFGETAVFEDTNPIMMYVAVTNPTTCQILSRDAIAGRLTQRFPEQVDTLQKICRARQSEYIKEALLERNAVLRQYAKNPVFLKHILPFLHLKAEAPWVPFYEIGQVKGGMYFIVSGDFEIRVGRSESYQTVNDGFIGEECLVTGCKYTTAAVSRTSVITLRLEDRGFHKLIAMLPELHEAIQTTCRTRLRDLQSFTEFFRHSKYFYVGKGNASPAFTQLVVKNCDRIVLPPGSTLDKQTGEVYHLAEGTLSIIKNNPPERQVFDLNQHDMISNPRHDPIHSAKNDSLEKAAVVYRFTEKHLQTLTAASPQDMLVLNETLTKPRQVLEVDKEARMYRLHVQNQLFQLEEEGLGLRQAAGGGGADAYRLGDVMVDKGFEKSRAVESWFLLPRPPSTGERVFRRRVQLDDVDDA